MHAITTKQLVAEQLKARSFANEILRPVAEVTCSIVDPAERFAATRPFYEALVAAGYLRKLIPAEVGGDNRSAQLTMRIVEELASVDPSVTLTALATTLGLAPVISAASETARDRLLAPFLATSGAPLAAFAFSEPGGSSNYSEAPPAEGTRTTVRECDYGWVIAGAKQWISNASGWDGVGADVTTVVAAHSDSEEQALSVFVVERGTRGVHYLEPISGTGLRDHLLPRILFDDVVVGHDALIGSRGDGTELVGRAFGSGVGVGALAVGIAKSALRSAIEFCSTERRGGRVPIMEHQAVAFGLVDAKARVDAARSLVRRAAAAVDNASPAAFELGLQAKVFASETSVDIISALTRIVGVESFSVRSPLSTNLMDALALPLISGSNNGVRRRQLVTLLTAEHTEWE